MRETITSGGTTTTLDFRYDSNGNPHSMTYIKGSSVSVYYYITNLQGDVVSLVNSSGTEYASYTYDPYGKMLTATGTMAAINPLRYRGYYYDTETGFYYLNSRYYDPATGRFINADGYASTGQGMLGYNMFAYCNNNPVCSSDDTGTRAVMVCISDDGGGTGSIGSNIVSASPNRLPPTGEPNSTGVIRNPDGTIKRKRWYGPDGKAERDRDFNHDGKMPFPHDHEWKDGKRGEEHLPPSPEYEISWNPVLGTGLVIVSALALAVVAVDDFLGVGVADDGLLVPLGAGVGKGLSMILGW